MAGPLSGLLVVAIEQAVAAPAPKEPAAPEPVIEAAPATGASKTPPAPVLEDNITRAMAALETMDVAPGLEELEMGAARVSVDEKAMINCRADLNQLVPFKYDWAWQKYIDGCANHWMPQEVNMSRDISQWKDPNALTEDERLIVKRNLGPQIFAFSRCMKEDVQRAIDTGVNGIVMEIPSSLHMVDIAYRWPMERAIETSIEATRFARDNESAGERRCIRLGREYRHCERDRRRQVDQAARALVCAPSSPPHQPTQGSSSQPVRLAVHMPLASRSRRRLLQAPARCHSTAASVQRCTSAVLISLHRSGRRWRSASLVQG